MTATQLPWKRIAGEVAVIVASVFIAISLESLWQEQQQATAAREALNQLLGELRQDRLLLDLVRAEQNEIDLMYQNLRAWLSEPSSMPLKDVGETIDRLAYSNRTMFVHHSAWTTMVAGGQLQLLDDPALVSRLGNLYENAVSRLDWNSENYDLELWTVMREKVPMIWDSDTNELITEDQAMLAAVRGQLRYLHFQWNHWYLDYLDEYQDILDSVITDVEAYLKLHGSSI